MLYSIARLYVEAKTAKSGGNSHDSHSDSHDQGQTQGQGHSQNQGSHPQGQGQSQGIDLGQIPETFGVEFDACLSALGLAPFVPTTSDSGHGHGPADSGHGFEHVHGNGHVGNADQTTRLENWFSGNQYMTGLLEEDLSLIDFST